MAVDEPQVVAIKIKTEPIVKPIQLVDIGFLQRESTYVNCPACERAGSSVVQLEAVTCLQRLLGLTKLFKTWRGRTDINHYCSNCGCYIGRFVPVGCSERCISRSAKRMAAVDDMTLKTKPRDCAQTVQKSRERVLAKRAQERAEKQAKREQQQTTVVTVELAPQAKA
ncbi:uncharacterized protein LOC115634003 [Scaptodrosophila lebanonensis]|uniref:Uncharacterized protein LOC115634003 n=1 Tax=Drosophila lebanonensis TaxID=7225 RepID=A0A6J2UJK5_DROLE|nr:uncharacterized protein LOC115634003 [Scaptodrosophila lebanonensis]